MNHKSEESIFAAAIEIESDAKRSQFLEQACGDDAELRKSVEELLANAQPDSLFQDVTRTIDGGQGIPQNGKQLGEFKIIRELGRGGMGVVYEAHQKSLNRNVALKVLSAGLGLTTRAIMRFRREAEAAGKLHHTNIVPIYSTGDDKGIHFYAMELVDGPSLDQVIKSMRTPNSNDAKSVENSAAEDGLAATSAADQTKRIPEWVNEKLPFNQGSKDTTPNTESVSGSSTGGSGYFVSVARMIADVADALDHAHDHGVIHRDIKPSNLLLGPDGRLSINDFGLARVLEQPGMTMSGEMMGTPRYMSPEQISAGRSKLDHRTDIYSLGATLYELLTLSPPFDGVIRDEVIGQILHKDPKPARKINPKIPKDLETICMAAIERDPDRRYQTAGLLAEDLRRFVDGRTPDKKRVGTVGKTIRWVKRHPSRTALIFVTLISIVAFLVVWQVNRLHARQTAMEDAFNYSIIGEYEIAKDKLELAASFGASQDWQNLIRGQIELFNGNDELALDYIEEVQVDSLKIQAECLRIILHFRCHDEVRYLNEIEILERSPIEGTSGLDDLYLGMAYSWAMPEKAENYIKSAAEKNAPHGVVSAYRSIALCNMALNTLTPESAKKYAGQALRHATSARYEFGENMFTEDLLATAHLVSAVLANRRNPGAAAEAIENIKDICDNIDKKYTGERRFLIIKFLYLREFKPKEVNGYLARVDVNVLQDVLLNIRLITSITSPEIIPEDDARRLKYGQYHRPILYLSQIFRGDNLQSIREEFKARLDNYPPNPNLGSQWDWALCQLLRVDPEKHRVVDAIDHIAQEYNHSFQAPINRIHLAIHRGSDEADLRAMATNRRQLTTVYFYLGIKKLAEGKVPEAKRLFEIGEKEGFFYFYNTYFCSILAKKLGEPGFEKSWKERLSELDANINSEDGNPN